MSAFDKDSAITLVNFSKFFEETEVISPLSFNFPRGRIAALVGKSEREKTLLLRSIAGTEAADSGDIVVNGRSLNRETSAFKREVFIVSSSVGIDLPGPLAKIPKILASVFLDWDYIAYRAWLDFLGLPEHLSFSELSQANKMKALTAIAVACGASVVLFESVDSYLDASQQRALMVTLNANSKKGKSAIIDTRRVSRWVEYDLDLYAFKNTQLMKVDRERLRAKVIQSAIVQPTELPTPWPEVNYSADESTQTMVAAGHLQRGLTQN